MKIKPEDVREKISAYIKEQFLSSEDEAVSQETKLISSGIMDSISVLHFVDFLEKTFDIEFEPHEVDADNLNTIALIIEFLQRKKRE